jgi:hypothetical protein
MLWLNCCSGTTLGFIMGAIALTKSEESCTVLDCWRWPFVIQAHALHTHYTHTHTTHTYIHCAYYTCTTHALHVLHMHYICTTHTTHTTHCIYYTTFYTHFPQRILHTTYTTYPSMNSTIQSSLHTLLLTLIT